MLMSVGSASMKTTAVRAFTFPARVVKYPDARSADRISHVPSNCGAFLVLVNSNLLKK